LGLGRYAGDVILAGIKGDLDDFGVSFDHWFSETDLYRQHLVDQSFTRLQKQGHLYEQDGALWFRASQFGDEKDRVVRRSNGATTYFASDVAYHLHKFRRGFDLVVDIWGGPPRLCAPAPEPPAQALGFTGRLQVILVQLVSLLRQGAGGHDHPGAPLSPCGRSWTKWAKTPPASFSHPAADAHLEFDLEVASGRATTTRSITSSTHARLASFRQANGPGHRGPSA
jgi:arginyl-tRNA synthetase